MQRRRRRGRRRSTASARAARPASPKRNVKGTPTNCTMSSAPMSAPSEMPELRPVGRGHPDDGLDAVVVEEERDQHQEGLAVAAQLAEGLAQAREADRDQALRPARGRPRARCGGSGTRRNRGIEKTSHHTATLRKETRMAAAGVGEAEPLRAAGSMSRLTAMSRPPAEVAEGVAGGGDAVHLVLAGDVGQQRLVEHDELALTPMLASTNSAVARHPVAAAR